MHQVHFQTKNYEIKKTKIITLDSFMKNKIKVFIC